MAADAKSSRIFVTQIEREVPIMDVSEDMSRNMTIPESNSHEAITIELNPDKVLSKIGKALSKYFLKSSDKRAGKDEHNYDIFFVDFLKVLKLEMPDYDIKVDKNIQQIEKLLPKFGFKVKGHYVPGLRLKSTE